MQDKLNFKRLSGINQSSGLPTGKAAGGPFRPVAAVAFSPDGKRLAAVSYDKRVRLWGIE